MDMNLSERLQLTLVLLSVIVVLAVSTWDFLIKKDYAFIIEVECDPVTEQCFYRDCSEEDACPPNNLENYRIFTLNAADYESCNETSCKDECVNETFKCEELVCGETEGDECAVQPSVEEESFETPEEG
jgi:hypothetical protein